MGRAISGEGGVKTEGGGSKIRGTVGRDVGQTDNKKKDNMKYPEKMGLNNRNPVYY